jgi:hypothetical protein
MWFNEGASIMNAKSKGFGLLAAVVLSLSMFGGAMAQNSDSVPVSTTLTGTNTVCSIDIYAVYGGFGTWMKSGGSYVEQSGMSTQYFFGDLYNWGSGCNIAVTFGGLAGPAGLIDSGNFTSYSNVEGSVNPATWGTNGFVGPWYDFDYTLNSVPASLTSGVYAGNIVATVTDAA